jgi:hypothetical protein
VGQLERYNANTLDHPGAETIPCNHCKGLLHHIPINYYNYGTTLVRKHATLRIAIANKDLSCFKLCSSLFDSGRKKGMK